MSETFFELLQVAIGQRSELTFQPSAEEWTQLYQECERQSLIGIGFCGIKTLTGSPLKGERQCPPKAQLVQWVQDAQGIKERNEQLNKLCQVVSDQLTRDGFWNCILKGQSNLPNYPIELRDYRTPGDIDIWAKGKSEKEVIEYALQLASKAGKPKPEVRYNHVELPDIWPVDVEIHHRPSFLSSPIHNRRLHKWFTTQPTTQFNAVYQLTHVYRHLFDEGIGLRQLLDYYFVLTKLPSGQKQKVMQTLDSFAMGRFAAAVMWVLQRVFALPDEYLLCPPNAREGEFLLSEIMQAGNFGQYDQRIAHHVGQFRHAWEKTKHNLRLLRHYPREVLWEPCFRLYHWLWRRFELWK